MKKITYLFIFIFSDCLVSQAQNAKIDSLKTLLQKEKIDTSKVNLINQIATENIVIADYDTAAYFAKQAINIADKISISSNKLGWPKGLADANNILRSVYFNKANFDEALKYANNALLLYKEINDDNGVAGILSNIGGIYWSKGDYPRALEEMFKGLKIYDKTKNKKGISKIIGNIGLVYWNQNELDKSLNYLFKAYELDKELNNNNGISRHLSNIGNVYYQKGDFKKSLQYYFDALKINEQLNNVNSIGINLGNIGNAYVEISEFDLALEYLFKAIEINKSIGNRNNVARDLGNIGTAYYYQKKYTLAENYLKQAIEVAKQIGSLDYIRRFEKPLSLLYFEKGDYKNAYLHYKNYSDVKDSIFNEEKNNDITRNELNYEYEKKELATKAENDKKAAVAAENSKRQKIIIWSVAFGLVLVAIILLIVFRALQITKNQKQIIEHQKEIVEEKHKEIQDSINYAKRIQDAIMPSLEDMQMALKNGFILYQPKDVVAGDFFWMEKINNVVYFAAADCTGHGVPGAMVSVVCSNALTKALLEEGIRETGKLLDRTRELVIERFAKSGDEVKDGMDISLCALNVETNELQWSGANNPLWIIRNNNIVNPTLLETKPDKQPIGKSSELKPFTTHQLKLEKEDTIYIFTDGYADQFGGEKGKKFKAAQLKEIILSIQQKPLHEQKEILKNTFASWKGSLEQVDDVCVIGVRV